MPLWLNTLKRFCNVKLATEHLPSKVLLVIMYTVSEVWVLVWVTTGDKHNTKWVMSTHPHSLWHTSLRVEKLYCQLGASEGTEHPRETSKPDWVEVCVKECWENICYLESVKYKNNVLAYIQYSFWVSWVNMYIQSGVINA